MAWKNKIVTDDLPVNKFLLAINQKAPFQLPPSNDFVFNRYGSLTLACYKQNRNTQDNESTRLNQQMINWLELRSIVP